MKQLFNQLSETSQKVNSFIEKIVILKHAPTPLFQAARHIIDAGGKRLRPYIVLKSCRVVGGRENDAIPTAAALELLHTFTLIHDDIMDKDEIRRGVSTVHIKWGIPTAIMAGDLLFAKVYESIIKYTNRRRVSCSRILEVLENLTEAAITVCKGQTLDMMFERKIRISEEKYFEMVSAKTAALLEVAAKCGGIIGGASRSQVESLGKFAYYAGVTFQLIDDVLGLTADEKTLGKPVGSDIREGKQTLIVTHALKHASEKQRKKIVETLGNDSASFKQIRDVITMFNSLGSINYAKKKAGDYAYTSKMSLASFDNESKLELLDLVDFIISRKH